MNIKQTYHTRSFPHGSHEEFITPLTHINIIPLQTLAPLIVNSITNGYYPGAVILASHKGEIIYRGVFGHQRIMPDMAPMCFETIFDVASLTKVVVTTTAVLQLVEQQKLHLDMPVAFYWNSFANHGKSLITIKNLLTHTSGLQECLASPELNEILPPSKKMANAQSWQGKHAALEQIISLHPLYQCNTKFLYSDVNFIILGYLVEIISGKSLDHYATCHIFKPAGMPHSSFLPLPTLRHSIAPTQVLNEELRWGEVHDPTAQLMGGVAGMAGLFSNATDLGIFAQIILNKGRIQSSSNTYLLNPATISLMTTRQTSSHIPESRGLGWDIHSSFSCRGNLLTTDSFGHTGWTGVSLWIDPTTDTWIVILTSRTHPTPANDNQLLLDRIKITDAIALAISAGSQKENQT